MKSSTSSNVLFVFDTNVLISAYLIKRSINAKAFNKALNLGKLAISNSTLSEFIEVLYRPKLDRYFIGEERNEIMAVITYKSVLVDPAIEIKECRDPKDNMFLELALAANVSCLISGDSDLLALHPFRGIPIMKAADFLQRF